MVGPDSLNKHGSDLYKKGDYEPALKQFDASLNMLRHNAEAWYGKGNCLFRLEKINDALNSYDRATDDAPFHARAWFARAVALQKLGRHFHALISLQSCVVYALDGDAAQKKKAAEAVGKYIKKGMAPVPDGTFVLIAQGYNLAADQQDFVHSIECFDKALQLGPAVSKAWQFKAMSLSALNRLNEAIEAYQKAVEIEDGNAVYWYNKAILHKRMDDFDNAYGAFIKAIDICPDYLEALSNLGNLLGILNRPEESLEYLTRAVEISPGAENPWFNKAMTEDQLGLSQEALFSYKKFLELASPANAKQIEHARTRVDVLAPGFRKSAAGGAGEPAGGSPQPQPSQQTAPAIDEKEAAFWNSKGIEYYNQGNLHEAIACFDKAIAFNPGAFRPLMNKAIALSDLGRHEEELGCLEKAAELEPHEAVIWLNLSSALSTLNRPDEALQAVNKSLELNSDDNLSWYNKGKIMVDLGQTEEAVTCYDQALKIAPDDTSALNNKGTCLLRLGDYYNAQACFERVTSLKPNHAFAWGNLGEALNRLKRYDMAIKYYEKALAIRQFASPWCGIGECLLNLQKTEDALAAFKKALDIYPQYTDAWLGKARCEEKLGRKDERVKSLKHCLAFAVSERNDYQADRADLDNARRDLFALGVSEAGLETELEAIRSAARQPKTKPKLRGGSGEFIGQKYEVYRVLGKGGFGVVYHVFNHDTGQVLALKTFRDEYMKDQKTRDLFKKEARILVDMDSHPFLVEDYYVDEVAGRIYIAMEYVAPDEDGLNTLEGYLQRKPPAPALALRWAIQFCLGMEFINSQGIKCHRDIKPPNIMITPQKDVKISDFGLAGIVSSIFPTPGGDSAPARCGAPGQTMMGGTFGTPTHMPPEQFVNAASCDERSDIYAFGIVLYQMASGGSLPFVAPWPKDNSPTELNRFWKAMHELHAFSSPPELDSPLFPVIRRCIEKEPDRRIQSFSQLRCELEPLLCDLTGETVRPPEPSEMNAGAWLNKGLSLKNLGRLDEALVCYDNAIDLNPPARIISLAWNNKGNCFLARGRFNESLSCYETALKLNAANEKAWCNKGFTLHNLGRFAEALKCYDQSLQIEPAYSIAWANKSNTYLSLADYEKAIICADEAVKYDRGNDAAWNNKGAAYFASGYLPEAMTCYQNALAINPNEMTTHYNMGLVFNNMKKYKEAIDCYDRVLAIRPNYAAVWCNKANTLMILKDYQQALACLDRAQELDPNYTTPLYYKAYVMLNMKNNREAKKYFEAFIKACPPDSTSSSVADAKSWLAKL